MPTVNRTFKGWADLSLYMMGLKQLFEGTNFLEDLGVKRAQNAAGRELVEKVQQTLMEVFDYPPSSPLAESTVVRRNAPSAGGPMGGFPSDAPGLMSGQFYNNIVFRRIDSGTIQVGVNEGVPHQSHPSASRVTLGEVVRWFEFGTSKQPPRPIFGYVANTYGPEIAQRAGIRILESLRNRGKL